MLNNMLAVQERELETVWFIKRIHFKIVLVFMAYIHMGL